MKKWFIFAFVMVFTLTAAGCAVGNRVAVADSSAVADDSAMLKANEEKAWEKATKTFPAERKLNVQQFKELYDKVMAGQEDAYLIDLRTHPEFYAAHIVGTNHIHAGHMYTFPKKIKKQRRQNCGVVQDTQTRGLRRGEARTIWLYQCMVV